MSININYKMSLTEAKNEILKAFKKNNVPDELAKKLLKSQLYVNLRNESTNAILVAYEDADNISRVITTNKKEVSALAYYIHEDGFYATIVTVYPNFEDYDEAVLIPILVNIEPEDVINENKLETFDDLITAVVITTQTIDYMNKNIHTN
ncbi:MAG: hypothetical protein E7134_00630 [Rikenellaceae bacterium]|nr:hypothetical protein [Rikenellaceae bacterium]